MMDEKRKRQLRKKYLRAENLVYKRLDEAPGCGISLLCTISVEVSEAVRVMDDIRAEVGTAMRGRN